METSHSRLAERPCLVVVVHQVLVENTMANGRPQSDVLCVCHAHCVCVVLQAKRDLVPEGLIAPRDTFRDMYDELVKQGIISAKN